MSRSSLPQSDADRIAVAATAVAVAAIVWVILAVALDSRDVSFATAHAGMTRHVDEGNRLAPPQSDCQGQFATPEAATAEPIARF